MKKVSVERRLWFTRVIKKRAKRNRLSKQKKKAGKFIESGIGPSNDYKLKYFRLSGPRTLGFQTQQSRNELLDWLQKLRTITVKKDQPVYIDFSKSMDSEAYGFLLMLAELDRIQSIKGKKYIRANKPNDNIAAQVFHQIGLSGMLNIKGRPPVTSKEVIYWNHINGTKIEADKAGKLIMKLATTYGLDDNSTENLYNGVTEAITNTIMHAYAAERGDNLSYGKNKWWMFAGVREDQLTVLVCDIGVGIPRSLKDKHPNIYQKFKEYFTSGNDSKLIQVAMEEGSSKSKQPHRGLGMTELKNFINTIGQGNLTIMSNKGAYFYYNKNHDENDEETSYNFTSSIMGTIIGWKVPMAALNFNHIKHP